MNFNKYLAYASFCAVLWGGMMETAQGAIIYSQEGQSQIVPTKQAPTRKQKEWYRKLKKEPDFKTFPKELDKKIKENLGGAVNLKNLGKVYEHLVIFPIEEGTGIVLDTTGSAPRVFFYKTRVYEKDIIPTYPRSDKAIEIEKNAAKYGTLKWFQMPQGIDELPAEQAREIKLLYKHVDDNFHFLYTAPFTKIDIKKLKKGEYNGMFVSGPELCFLSSDEDKISRKIQSIGYYVSVKEALKIADNITHNSGRCDLYGTYSIDAGDGRATVGGLLYVQKANWKLNDWQADTIRKRIVESQKSGIKGDLVCFIKNLKIYAKETAKIKEEVFESQTQDPSLSPYQKEIVSLINQLQEKVDIILQSNELSEKDKPIEGALIDKVNVNAPHQIVKQDKPQQRQGRGNPRSR